MTNVARATYFREKKRGRGTFSSFVFFLPNFCTQFSLHSSWKKSRDIYFAFYRFSPHSRANHRHRQVDECSCQHASGYSLRIPQPFVPERWFSLLPSYLMFFSFSPRSAKVGTYPYVHGNPFATKKVITFSLVNVPGNFSMTLCAVKRSVRERRNFANFARCKRSRR